MHHPTYTIHPEGGGWTVIRWKDGTRHNLQTERAFDLAAELPGVIRYDRCLKVPDNALPFVDELVHKHVGRRLERQASKIVAPQWRPTKRPLYLHQHEAVSWALKTRRGLLADDMGLGKTASAIAFGESVRRFYDSKRPAVILAQKSLRGTWLRELQAVGVIDSPDEVSVLESKDHDDDSLRPASSWILVNPEIVRDWWSKILMQRPCVTLIDEAHMYKSLQTGRSKGAMMVSTAPYLLLMTGTPIVNRPSDLWSLMTLINGRGSWGSPNAFRKRYAGAEFTGHGWKDGALPTNTEELRARVALWYLRRELGDINVKMPALSRSVIECSWEDARLGLTLQKKHKTLFQASSPAQILRALKEGKFTNDVLTVLSQLRSQTSQAKVEATVEHVEHRHAGGAEPVVVFVWSKASAATIADRCTRFARKVWLCTGDVDQRVRDRSVVEFQRDGGILVATYGVFAQGVTLHRARFVVHHDLGWLPHEISQAEKRIHRIGQDRPCVADWIVLRDSIDEIFAKVIDTKLRAIGEILQIRDENIEAMVAKISKQPDVQKDIEESLAAWRSWT
jgi:SWI/SNF-related matrix-associated actin-dependent regulator of chromatin subfamily A-like protein 1